MNILLEVAMKGAFITMMLTALFYFGYVFALSKCKSFEIHGILSNRTLIEVAGKCFEGRHVSQFVLIVKVFKYSFLTLIILMVAHGVLGKIT